MVKVKKSLSYTKHGAPWDVDEVRALLEESFGDLLHLSIAPVAGDWELHVTTEREKWGPCDEEEPCGS